jgi:hypothetical protein
VQPAENKEQSVPRDWLNLTCEHYLNGKLVSSSVREIHPTGFVAETNSALEPGLELELRLLGGPISSPVYLRCAVETSEAQTGPRAATPFTTRFRLLAFSPDYTRLLFGASERKPSDSTLPQDKQTSRDSGEREWLADIVAEPQMGKRTHKQPPATTTEWEEYEPLAERAGVPLFEDDALKPEAFVIDDGELDDVVEILSRMGVKTERRTESRSATHVNWVPPQRLLVMSEKLAMTMHMPLDALDGDFMSVAVGDSDARMVGSRLRLLGFKYWISRPVHPAAMSMLFRQALFDEGDQRLAPRVILGCPIGWRQGWSLSKTGTLLDLSPQGCQLLIQETVPENSRIRISLPRQTTTGFITLKGRVVRSTSTPAATWIGVLFDSIPERASREVAMLLMRSGPLRLDSATANFEATRPWEESSALEEERSERRQKNRVALQQEIVALEPESMRPRFTLMGRDLSPSGMRVEPHPSLELDAPLFLALYAGAQEDPLIVSATTARNDGRAGWLLRFVDLDADTQARLGQVLTSQPSISRVDKPDSEPGRVILGQLLDSSRENVGGEPD